MGTRSLTIFQEKEEIAVLYRQFDGYPEGHGRELAEFLSGYKFTKGKIDNPKTANGMDCLAAQIVAHFKTERVLPYASRHAQRGRRIPLHGLRCGANGAAHPGRSSHQLRDGDNG